MALIRGRDRRQNDADQTLKSYIPRHPIKDSTINNHSPEKNASRTRQRSAGAKILKGTAGYAVAFFSWLLRV